MKVAVQFYSNVPNKPKGIPNEWPAYSHVIAEDAPHPGENWVVMEHEDYENYLVEKRPAYDEYERKAALEAPKFVERVIKFFRRTG